MIVAIPSVRANPFTGPTARSQRRTAAKKVTSRKATTGVKKSQLKKFDSFIDKNKNGIDDRKEKLVKKKSAKKPPPAKSKKTTKKKK